MKLYLVERTDKWSYDDYDAFVCVAPTSEAARWMAPDPDYHMWKEIDGKPVYCYSYREQEPVTYGHSWVKDLDNIKIKELGEAFSDKSEVVLASFNPG